MKRTIVIFALAFSVFAGQWVLPACAAPAGQTSAAPAATANPTQARTLFDYQKQLGLTDKQVKDVKDALQGLETYVKSQQEKLVPIETQVAKLINSNGSLDQIKSLLQQAAPISIDIRMADIATSRKINGILTPNQLAQWREIQKKAREQSAAQSTSH